MKVLLLGPANSVHMRRLCIQLLDRGHEVHLVSVHFEGANYPRGVNCYSIRKTSFWYFKYRRSLARIVSRIKPDVVNAHYATGYGLLGVSVNSRPLALSVWGSDVYEFPRRSKIHEFVTRFVLQRADVIASTSKCMAEHVNELRRGVDVFVTPFGVDTQRFFPTVDVKERLNRNFVRFGTVKALESVYGIDTLIRSFAVAMNLVPKTLTLELEIYGTGSQLKCLQLLAKHLGVADNVKFRGFIENSDVPRILNRFDIFCAFSRRESFGVAAVEAGAAGLPMILSNADGLVEVMGNSGGAIVLSNKDEVKAGVAMADLATNKIDRRSMGLAAREHVVEHYCSDVTIRALEACYYEAIKKYCQRNK